MTLSDVDICNLALDEISQTNITSLNDGTKTSTICARNLNMVVRAVLRAGRWKSARIKLSLAQRSDLVDPAAPPPTAISSIGTLVGGWPPGNQNYTVTDDGPTIDGWWGGPVAGSPLMPYAFQLPTDFLRIVRFNDVDSAATSYPFWEQRADILWTNQTVAFLEYVRDVTMPGTVVGSNPPTLGTLDADLQNVIVKGLAARLAWVFQQSTKQQMTLKQEYQLVLSSALAVDARSEKVALRSPLIDSTWIRARWNSTNH